MDAHKPRVLIVGMGGVGTMAAYALQTGGRAEITAVLRSNYEAVAKNGFDIDSIDHGQNRGWRPAAIMRTVPDVVKEQMHPFDFILVTTKNIPEVPPTLEELISPAVTIGQTVIVLCQNGLNIEKGLLRGRYKTNIILSSISLISVAETSHGNIVHDDHDKQFIGPFPNPATTPEAGRQAAEQYISLYNAVGNLDITYDQDVTHTRWRKLLYNASYNTVSTVLRMDTARMRMSMHIIDDLIRPIMMEIMEAAKATGCELDEDLPDKIIRTDPTEVEIKPSMLQDIEKGNFIELETIAGEPLREGAKRGVMMPTLRTMYAVLKGLQLKTMEARGMWRPEFTEGNPYR